jgi:hypothetical protein
MSRIDTPAADGLNPFPGYPVVSIGGAPERTVTTPEIRQSRDVVREHVKRWQPVEVGQEHKAGAPVEWAVVARRIC